MWKIIADATKPSAEPGRGPARPGWKRAVDEELEASGGAMPWKRLCVRVVERFRATEKGGEHLELQAWAV